MRILQLIFLDLLLVSPTILILGEKLSEGILPQREKETHFPAMPNMPNMFILVSGNPKYRVTQQVLNNFFISLLDHFKLILGHF